MSTSVVLCPILASLSASWPVFFTLHYNAQIRLRCYKLYVNVTLHNALWTFKERLEYSLHRISLFLFLIVYCISCIFIYSGSYLVSTHPVLHSEA